MSKALIVASVASMIDQFNRPNIKLLKELGYDVHVACNYIEGSTCSSEKIQQLKTDLQTEGVTFSQIDFARNITRITQNLRAYRQIKRLLKQEKYDLIHCHSPIGGLLTRMAAKKYRKTGTKVIYTAHGFHFYKGAPLINWLLYYPVEWLCAHWTDVLITINKEDYARAKKRMHAKRVEYVPGVGIDLQKFASNRLTQEKKESLQESVGVVKGDRLLLSVGELNANKNHEAVIRALANIEDKSVHYAIAGAGDLHDYLMNLANELGISERIHLLGYRDDVADFYGVADLYIHPSLREGLSVALMEAIASKTAVICSDIRGNTDLVGENALFEPKNVNQIADKICEYLNRDNSEEIEKNYDELKKFGLEEVSNDIKAIYSELNKQ